MKTQTSIVCNVDDFQFGYWDHKEEKFIPVNNQASIELMAKYLNCSLEVIDTLMVLFENFGDAVRSDLIDIWQQLNE
jgi:hypothetical protein